jgi:hypothetical protein
MTTPPDVVKIKLSRKRLLETLNIIYPTPLQTKTVFESISYVDSEYDFPLFKKDVAYLVQKGYLEFIDEKIGGLMAWEKKVIGLTAEGKEIAEHTQNDPALEI